MLRPTGFAVVWTLGVLLTGVAIAQEQQGPDVSQEAVDALIEQMASGDFRQRTAAYNRLEAMGVEAVGFLDKHSNHARPEVRARVRKLIESYAWMRVGRIIWKVTPDSQASRLGLRIGDVVLKVNDVGFGGGDAFTIVDDETRRKLTLLRGGKRLEVDVEPGTIGIGTLVWALDKRGRALHDGLRGIADERYTVALEHMETAYAAGADGRLILILLAGLRELAGKQKQAMEAYRSYRRSSTSCWASHQRRLDAEYMNLPISALHSAWLLERYRKLDDDDFDPWLIHQLCDWAEDQEPNYPLLVEVLKRPWHAEETRSSYTGHYARSLIAMHLGAGQWKQAQEVHKRFGELADGVDAFRAAYLLGDVDEVCAMALRQCADGHVYQRHLMAIALAYAAGRVRMGEKLLRAIMDAPATAQRLSSWRQLGCLVHVACADAVAGEVEALLAEDSSMRLRQLYLELMAATSDLTEGRWRIEYRRFSPPDDDNSKAAQALRRVHLQALMRLGCYDEAVAMLDAAKGKTGSRILGKRLFCFRNAAKLLKNNTEKLDGPWKILDGTVMLSRGRGCQWAHRWDGRVFRIRDGKVDEPGGYDPGKPWACTYEEAILRAAGGNTQFCRAQQLYVFDSEQDKWVRTYINQRDGTARLWVYTDAPGVAMIDYLLKEHGTPRPDRSIQGAGRVSKSRWWCYTINDDINLMVRDDGHLLDVCRRIGALAGLGRPAKVTEMLYNSHEEKLFWILTDAGLWTIDREGTIERFALGLKDPDVWIRRTSYPGRPQDVLMTVSVVCQQGGRMFDISRDYKVTPLKMRSGRGPWDNYARRYVTPKNAYPEQPILEAYTARVARQGADQAQRD